MARFTTFCGMIDLQRGTISSVPRPRRTSCAETNLECLSVGRLSKTSRTFWSFNYEGRRETRESVQETFWFPQAFRNGDFSGLADPADSEWCADSCPDHHLTILSRESPFAIAREPFQHHSGRPNQPQCSNIHQQVFSLCRSLRPEDILDTNVRRRFRTSLPQTNTSVRIDHHVQAATMYFPLCGIAPQWDQDNLNPNFPYFTNSVAHNRGVSVPAYLQPADAE